MEIKKVVVIYKVKKHEIYGVMIAERLVVSELLYDTKEKHRIKPEDLSSDLYHYVKQYIWKNDALYVGVYTDEIEELVKEYNEKFEIMYNVIKKLDSIHHLRKTEIINELKRSNAK